MTDREVLTWDGFGDAARELAQTVADDGFRPDLILTVARGGLLPAGAPARRRSPTGKGESGA